MSTLTIKFFTHNNNSIALQREWVQLTIGSTSYQLDPAFKASQPVTPLFSLTGAMGGASTTISNALLSAAGGSDSTSSCSGLSEASVRGTLTGYTTNFLNYLQSNAPNASVQQVLGGWQITPAGDSLNFTNNTQFAVINPFGTMPVLSWVYEPTNLMSTFQMTFAGTNYQWYMPQLQGQRISLTYSNNGVAQLWQDDTFLAQGQAILTGGTNSVVLATTHPIGTWNTSANTFVYNATNTANMTVAK